MAFSEYLDFKKEIKNTQIRNLKLVKLSELKSYQNLISIRGKENMYRKMQVAGRFCHNCHMLGKVDQKVKVDHKVQVCNRHMLGVEVDHKVLEEKMSKYC